MCETKLELQKKLDVLRKNRENIPETELKKGRYAVAYKKLLAEIKQLANSLIAETMSQCKVDAESIDTAVALFAEFKKPLKDALYTWYDADLVTEILDDYLGKLLHEVENFVICYSFEEEEVVL